MKSDIEAMRRQLAAAEANNDTNVNRLRSIIGRCEGVLRNRVERDEAFIAAVKQDQAEFTLGIEKLMNDAQTLISDLTGAPKHIDHQSTTPAAQVEQQQAAE